MEKTVKAIIANRLGKITDSTIYDISLEICENGTIDFVADVVKKSPVVRLKKYYGYVGNCGDINLKQYDTDGNLDFVEI